MNPGNSKSDSDSIWDIFRKEARKIEGELDVKLAAYAKLCASYDATKTQPSSGFLQATSPSPEQVLRTRFSEIEASLQRLGDVNTKLAHGVGVGDARSHMLARHRDILAEFTSEARRLNSMVGAARDRAELLSASASETAPLMGVQVQGSSGGLLRERTVIQSSSNAMEDVIEQADAVSRNLKDQRRVFETIGDKLMSIGSKFPVVNGLLKAIGRKKSRDTIILACVIAGCLLMLIIYMTWR